MALEFGQPASVDLGGIGGASMQNERSFPLLDTIDTPTQLRALAPNQLSSLASEIGRAHV